MVDWPFASRLAGTIAGEPPYRPLADDLDAVAEDSLARVRAYTHLIPDTPLPGPEQVTRKASRPTSPARASSSSRSPRS